jgi:hypothetical protein
MECRVNANLDIPVFGLQQFNTCFDVVLSCYGLKRGEQLLLSFSQSIHTPHSMRDVDGNCQTSMVELSRKAKARKFWPSLL